MNYQKISSRHPSMRRAMALSISAAGNGRQFHLYMLGGIRHKFELEPGDEVGLLIDIPNKAMRVVLDPSPEDDNFIIRNGSRVHGYGFDTMRVGTFSADSAIAKLPSGRYEYNETEDVFTHAG